MSNTNIQTIEGTEYKVTLNVSGVANLTDYRVEGSCKAIGSCAHGIKPFRVAEVTDSSVVMFIPTLASGSYLYQVFITRISTNQEFMVLEGRIDVSNKIKANEDTTIAPTGTVADVTLNAETVEVTVAITEGTAGKDGINGKDGIDGEKGEKGEKGERGEKGEQGEKGEKGDAFTFDDFTPEQLASLKGEKGDKGDPGESGGASIDWVQNTDKGVMSIGKNQKLTYAGNSSYDTQNSIVIGNTVTVAYEALTEGNVVIGHSTEGSGCLNTVIGYGAKSYPYTNYGVAIGYGADTNSNSVSVGYETWTSVDSVAIGYYVQSNTGCIAIGSMSTANNYSIVIGNNCYADDGNITLRSGNVVVKFAPEGITLNGEPYGQGGNSGGTDYAQQMLYKVKYAHADLCEVRSSQFNEYRDYYDEYGNYQGGYNHYPYYDDISPNGEWYYDLKTTANPYSSGEEVGFNNSQFNECPILKKFVAKIGRDSATRIYGNFFYDCQTLEEVIIHVECLAEATNMFYNCPKVHTFYADLSKLEGGSCMFGSDSYSCTSLNVESVEHIANSISYYSGEIYIGMARELQWDNGDGKYSRCQEALNKIRNKGWTVFEIYSENY